MTFTTRNAIGVAALLMLSGWGTSAEAITLASHDWSAAQLAAPEARLITSDVANSHTTTAGLVAFGLNTDGVGRLSVDNDAAAGIDLLCTGALLSTGRHLLTSAHCVTDASGGVNLYDGASLSEVTFELPGGPQSYSFGSADVTVHPLFSGNYLEGNDLAIITFAAPLPAEIPRYDLWEGQTGDEFDAQSIKVGYGRGGHGGTGPFATEGVKRAGLNEYEGDAYDLLYFYGGSTGQSPFAGSVLPLPGDAMVYDFDSGLAENNLITSDANDLGYGNDEVMLSAGDSGGPTFVFDPIDNRYEIAGVMSYGFGFQGLPDALPGTNGSWGEFGIDVRVSQHLGFIRSVTAPEPTSVALAATVALALAAPRRRAA